MKFTIPIVVVLFFTITTAFLSTVQQDSTKEAQVPYLYPSEIKEVYKACFDSTKLSMCDRAAWNFSFLGDYQQAINSANVQFQRSKRDSVLELQNFSLQTAHDYIIEQAKQTSVVMFNESHHRPEHRIYTADYLEELYELGFRYLGLEGLRENKDSLFLRGRPNIDSGYYTKEPQFANLIRHALNLGYTVFPYDLTKSTGKGAERIKSRERNQARALAGLFKHDTKAKLVVHMGPGHIREDTAYFGGLAAYQFKKMTGINPLTVGQARYNSEINPELNHPYYQHYPTFDKVSTLIYDSLNVPYNDSIVDIDVFHPSITTVLNRPSYLLNNKRYQHQQFALPTKIDYPVLACLYTKETKMDYLKEIPVDMVLLENKKDSVRLCSPFSGTFEVVFFDKDKQLAHKQMITFNSQE